MHLISTIKMDLSAEELTRMIDIKDAFIKERCAVYERDMRNFHITNFALGFLSGLSVTTALVGGTAATFPLAVVVVSSGGLSYGLFQAYKRTESYFLKEESFSFTLKQLIVSALKSESVEGGIQGFLSNTLKTKNLSHFDKEFLVCVQEGVQEIEDGALESTSADVLWHADIMAKKELFKAVTCAFAGFVSGIALKALQVHFVSKPPIYNADAFRLRFLS